MTKPARILMVTPSPYSGPMALLSCGHWLILADRPTSVNLVKARECPECIGLQVVRELQCVKEEPDDE